MGDGYLSREEHTEAMRRLDEENRRQNHRLDLLEKNVTQMTELTVSMEKLAVGMENLAKEQTRIRERTDEQDKKLDDLSQRDGQMWRTVVTHIITLIVGAVVAYGLSRIGL